MNHRNDSTPVSAWRRTRRSLLIAAAWLVVLFVVCSVYAHTRWTEMIDRGRSEYRAGKYDEAIASLKIGLHGAKGVLGSRRMQAVALSNLGEVYRAEGKTEDAYE